MTTSANILENEIDRVRTFASSGLLLHQSKCGGSGGGSRRTPWSKDPSYLDSRILLVRDQKDFMSAASSSNRSPSSNSLLFFASPEERRAAHASIVASSSSSSKNLRVELWDPAEVIRRLRDFEAETRALRICNLPYGWVEANILDFFFDADHVTRVGDHEVVVSFSNPERTKRNFEKKKQIEILGVPVLVVYERKTKRSRTVDDDLPVRDRSVAAASSAGSRRSRRVSTSSSSSSSSSSTADRKRRERKRDIQRRAAMDRKSEEPPPPPPQPTAQQPPPLMMTYYPYWSYPETSFDHHLGQQTMQPPQPERHLQQQQQQPTPWTPQAAATYSVQAGFLQHRKFEPLFQYLMLTIPKCSETFHASVIDFFVSLSYTYDGLRNEILTVSDPTHWVIKFYRMMKQKRLHEGQAGGVDLFRVLERLVEIFRKETP